MRASVKHTKVRLVTIQSFFPNLHDFDSLQNFKHYSQSSIPALSSRSGKLLQQIFGDSGPSGPVTAVAVCIIATCSYISVEVHVRLWCRARRRVCHVAVGTSLVQHRIINQA